MYRTKIPPSDPTETNPELTETAKGRFVVQPLDLSALVRDMMPLLQASTSRKASLRFELAESLPAVIGDAAQLRQVAMNLVINASESFGAERGAIHVRTGRMRPDRAYFAAARLAPETFDDADYVYLEVADDGCGMDAETLARVFEHFFSMKFTGRGLGLAAVLGIVQSHRGALRVDSEPERGSTFRMLLPETSRPAEPLTRPVPGASSWRGQGTALVVDDERVVRDLIRVMLERLGFRVLQAEHGQAAVEVFRAQASEIDVVFLDLTMPHMDGEQTFRELQRLHLDTPVILMSGYDERQSMESFAAPGLAGFLQKPFRLNEIIERLRHALEA